MTRQRVCALLVFGATLVGVQGVSAHPISPLNPYKSYHLSGINDGSMKWERTHRKQGTLVRQSPTVRYYVPVINARRAARRR